MAALKSSTMGSKPHLTWCVIGYGGFDGELDDVVDRYGVLKEDHERLCF